MLSQLKDAIGALVAKIHNGWLYLPAWLRKGLRDVVVAVIALAFAFGFQWPANLDDLKAQIVAFWILAVPAAAAVIRTEILPPLVSWFLETFGYVRPLQLSKMTPLQADRWRKAA
jgi:hypothetical protein